MILAELRTILGRRFSFLAALLLPLAVVVLTTLVFTVLRLANIGEVESVGGRLLFTILAGFLGFSIPLLAMVIGALTGSYDAAQGTLRYRVATGVGRWKLFLIRIPALVITCLIAFLPAALLLGLVVQLPHTSDTSTPMRDVGQIIFALLFSAIVYALISMAIGSFFTSNSIAIAMSLLFGVGSLVLLPAVNSLNSIAAKFLLPWATNAMTDFNSSAGQAALASVVVALWLAVFLVLGGFHLARSEV